MSTFSDPTPIATPEQYRAALLAVRQRMTAIHLAMLQAHCQAAEHRISASRLAEILDLPTAASANLKYSTYAHWIADELQYTPNHPSRGSHRWWLALAHGQAGAADSLDGRYEWIMRPELVATLQAMKWV